MIVSAALALLSISLGQTGSVREPYAVLPLPPAAELSKQLADVGKLSVTGEEMTFVYQGKVEGVQLMGGIQKPLQKVPDTEDLWALRIRVPNADQAVVTWGFLLTGPVRPTSFKADGVYRGPKAEPALTVADPLQGKIEPFEIDSKALGEKRKGSLYLPPSSLLKPGQKIFALYAADGASKMFAEVMEPLMLAGELPPIAIVGLESGGYRGEQGKSYDPEQDMRAKEYIREIGKERFDGHLKFFSEEAVAWAEKKYGIGGRRENRGVIGFSNGGVFAAEVGLRKGDVFGLSVPLSVGIVPELTKPKVMPQFYLCAGTLEPGFLRATTIFARQIMDWKGILKFNERVCGHDQEMWKSEGVKAMRWYFGR
ncbi:MAG: hypothetical protein KF784_06085 [Fimbriimonadaceae bacterium]|nr:hypothetical protein [Fimbriimonadaceae bacterium]